MSEQLGRIESALVRIESTVEGLKTDVAGLKADVAGLKTDVAGLKTDVAGLKTDVAGLKTDVAGLKTDVAGLKTDVARLDAGQIELGHQMRALHEEALQRIAAVPDSMSTFERRLKAEISELKESIDRRLDPLVWAVKAHSADIAELQRWRDAH